MWHKYFFLVHSPAQLWVYSSRSVVPCQLHFHVIDSGLWGHQVACAFQSRKAKKRLTL